VDKKPDDTACLVVLSGELDFSEEARVKELLPAPDRCSRVVIDCSAVTYLDSAVIAVLAAFRREFKEAGGDPLEIVLIASPAIDRALAITGMKRLITVLPARNPEEPAQMQ
jgi:anti-anti-sigma factor